MMSQDVQFDIDSRGLFHVPGRVRMALLCLLLCALPAAADDSPVRDVDTLPQEQRRAFLRGTLSDWRIGTDAVQGVPPPLIQKPYADNAKRLDLIDPDTLTLGTMSVRDAICNRRSRRAFTTESVTLAELSYLLWSTQGISRIDTNAAGQVIAHYRTVPSGGARHPFESYVVVQRVACVAPGLYRYLPVEHQLLLIREDKTINTRVMQSCYGQTFIKQAAVTFVWTAVPYRTEWKYGSIAQKLIAIEAGHVCQNLYLAAESLHIGVCASMGYNQTKMDALLELDGCNEFVVYLAAAGKLAAPFLSPNSK